jgi:hypothetical protein
MHSASNALKQPQHQVRQHRLLPLHLPQLLRQRQQQWHLQLHRLWLPEQLGLLLPLWQLLRLWLHRQPLPLLLLRLQGSPGRWDFSRAWWSLSPAALGQRLKRSACLSGRPCQNSTR